MNKIDFTTNPAGFPLESDATLGLLQKNIYNALYGILKALYNPHLFFPIIVSGCEVTSGVMSDGWVLHTDGELYFFEGGAVQNTAIIVENKAAKNNQDGTPVDRYYERKMTFGSGSGSFQGPIDGFGQVLNLATGLHIVGTSGYSSGGWVILQGLEALSGGSGGIDSGVAMYDNKLVFAGTYNNTVSNLLPVWLDKHGAWHQSDPGSGLKFAPHSNLHLITLNRKALHPVGSIQFVANGSSALSNYFVAGEGVSLWDGFNIADGTNGTIDLSTSISGVTAIQRMS